MNNKKTVAFISLFMLFIYLMALSVVQISQDAQNATHLINDSVLDGDNITIDRHSNGSITINSLGGGSVYDDTWLNSSDGKVNKTGDIMTGNLEVPGNITIGEITSSYGFIQNYSGGYGLYGSISNYDTVYGSYIGVAENAYFNRSAPPGLRWTRANVSKGSIYIQMVAIDPAISGGDTFSLQVYAAKANLSSTGQIYSHEFIPVLLVYDNRAVFSSVHPVTISNSSGAGNAYACLDTNGQIYRGSPTC